MSPQRQLGRAVDGNAKEEGPDAQLFAHAEALVARRRFTFDMPEKAGRAKRPAVVAISCDSIATKRPARLTNADLPAAMTQTLLVMTAMRKSS